MQWDFIGVRYDNKSFSVTGQDGAPHGFFFKPDGSKMYIAGNNSNKVYQYSLSTPWDISTASYDNVSFDVSGQEDLPTSVFFKSDGTKMYITGLTTNKVYQYSLSTPWDISTASYDNVSFDVSGQESLPREVFFKPDGSKMYMAGNSTNKVYQYSLSTPWDISSASYDNLSFDISGQGDTMVGAFFKSDGTKMWAVEILIHKIYQYSLSTPWDISSASYDDVSFDVGGQDINPREVFFKPDGSKMYMVGDGTNTVYQYSLSIPTPTAYAYTYIGG